MWETQKVYNNELWGGESMEDLLEVKLKLTKKQLEDLCLYMGEQNEVHTKFIIELLNLKLN